MTSCGVLPSLSTDTRMGRDTRASGARSSEPAPTQFDVMLAVALGTDAKSPSVHTIRVPYLTRESAHPEGSVIDAVEFRKNSKGDFEIHVT